MTAPDRANDPARRFVKNEPVGYSLSDGSHITPEHDEQAQRYFSAHGLNKGKAGSMNIKAAVEQAVKATGHEAKRSRNAHRASVEASGNNTETQYKQY